MKTIKNFKVLLLACSAVILTIAGCTKEEQSQSEASNNPVANKLDPERASGNTVLTVTGSGLGDMTSIVFENGNVPASFNPVLNTDNAIIFRVPDTANGGTQNIVLTNRIGAQVKVPFNVVALPLVNTVSNYNFTEGTEITLVGNNLADVTTVTLDGTSAAASIVSQTKKQLVIKMPATTVNSAKLIVTNSTGPVTTSQEFVNTDNAFKIFTEGYDNNYQNASWGSDAFVSSTVAKSGTKSVGKSYAKGNWHQLGFGWDNFSNTANYKYLTFWIKGASLDYSLYISTSASVGGFASFNENAKIAVPANVWTYYKLPLSTLNLWATSTAFNQIGWRIQGPETQDETFYLDDVMFVK
ncbi:MAG TPA: IPT/TIG domain-containing protein [Pedobacter sp.]|nr:IPT/TIG domain-containing protein [Pedobacter sp.]